MQRSWSFQSKPVPHLAPSERRRDAATKPGAVSSPRAVRLDSPEARRCRSCCIESRSRTLTAWSLSESKFTGDAEWGAGLILLAVPAADRTGVVVTVGRSILVIAWHPLSDPGPIHRPGTTRVLRHPHRPQTSRARPLPPARSPRLQSHPPARHLTCTTTSCLRCAPPGPVTR
jgi:hypothetical protein